MNTLSSNSDSFTIGSDEPTNGGYFNGAIDEVRISDKKIVFASGAEIAFDVLISSLPLPQAQQLLGMPITNDLAFYPCLAVGLVLDQALKTNFTAFKYGMYCVLAVIYICTIFKY